MLLDPRTVEQDRRLKRLHDVLPDELPRVHICVLLGANLGRRARLEFEILREK